MLREMNELLAARGFGALILDYEWQDLVSCRVLIDGWYAATIHAANRDDAIKMFESGEWRKQE